MSEPWGFGIVRPSQRGEGRGLLEDLCRAASESSGVPLRPVVARSYDELADALVAGDLGVAWLPPVPTLDVVTGRGGNVLAIPSRRGATSYHAALIVRRGGPRSLADLRGRRAAWVHKESAAGYLLPRIHLAAEGFDPLRFFAREFFVHSHAGVVDAVVNGEADVGATFCNVDPTTRKVIRSAWLDEAGEVIRPIDALTTLGPIPNDALVASIALPLGVRSTLSRWLLSLGADPSEPAARARETFERLVGSSEFRVPPPAHYKALEHALRAARARGHAALPPSSRMRIRLTK